MTTFTKEQRKNLTKKKMAMPDGSYPIRNRSDLRNAISSYGRAKNKPAVKAWIISRAKELDSEDLIPTSWENDIRHVSYNTSYLSHHGVKGMKWGVRKQESSNTYTSRKTKKLKRKAYNSMLNSNNLKKMSKNKAYSKKQREKFAKSAIEADRKAKTLHGQSIASEKRDKRMLKEYNNTSPGAKYVNTLIAGPIGHTYVSSLKASGLSTGKARVMSYLTGAPGAAYYRNKSIKTEGKKYEKSYVNDGYYKKRR